jgi:hypothetical protein
MTTHNEGAPPQKVDALASLSMNELVDRADRLFEYVGLPNQLLADLLDGMAATAASRKDRQCPCGEPVDMSGRISEMLCWRCFLDRKADNQRRRRVS